MLAEALENIRNGVMETALQLEITSNNNKKKNTSIYR